MAFQSPFDSYFDRSPFLPPPALRCDLIQAGGTAGRRVRFLKPLVQQWHEFAHVFEAELQRLEPADGGLGKHITIQRTQREPNVRLREAQFDPPLLELFGKLLQVVRGWRVLVRLLVVTRVLLLVQVKGLLVRGVAEVRAVVVFVRVL